MLKRRKDAVIEEKELRVHEDKQTEIPVINQVCEAMNGAVNLIKMFLCSINNHLLR